MVIWFFVLAALAAGKCLGVILEPCGDDGIFEIQEYRYRPTRKYFSCRLEPPFNQYSFLHLVFYANTTTTRYDVGWCRTSYYGFYEWNYPSYYNDNEWFLANYLTIEKNSYSNEKCSYALRKSYPTWEQYNLPGSVLICRHETKEVNCTIDIVYPSAVACEGTFVTDTIPWTVQAECNITKAYSALGRYSCQLFERSLNSTNATKEAVEPLVPMTTMPTGSENYVSGSCQMTTQLPSKDGIYNYSVHIAPGNITVLLTNFSTFEIKRPLESNLSHNCPDSVDNASTISCTCGYEGQSTPPSTVKWTHMDSNLLEVSSVTPQQQGQTFVCQLTWNEEIFTKIYTLNVLWDPSTKLSHTCPDYVTEGSDLECKCVTDDLGNPPASLKWKDRTSADLTWKDITRDDNATPFTCELSRDGKLLKTLSYVLRVRSSSAGLSSSQEMAIGLGVGLSVAAICVTIIVVVVLRRKRHNAPQNGLTTMRPSSLAPPLPDAPSVQGRRSGQAPRRPYSLAQPSPDAASEHGEQARPNYDSLQKRDNLDGQYEDMQLNQKASQGHWRSAPQDADRSSDSNFYGNMDSPDGDEVNDPVTYGNTA